jgi:hypothetical protein
MVTEKPKKKIGVTGINGFIAYHLIKNFGVKKERIKIMERYVSRKIKNEYKRYYST